MLAQKRIHQAVAEAGHPIFRPQQIKRFFMCGNPSGPTLIAGADDNPHRFGGWYPADVYHR
jgi:hypothetical protein